MNGPAVRLARAAGASLVALTFAVSSTAVVAGRERHIAQLIDVEADTSTGTEPISTAALEAADQHFSFAYASSYAHLHQTLNSLASLTDEETGEPFDVGAISTAATFLRKAEQLCWSAPNIDWHGNDAIVLTWARASKILFFTITEGMIGFFAETDGEIGKRHSSIAFDDQTDLLDLSGTFGAV